MVLNMQSCESCTVAGRHKEDCDSIMSDLDALDAIMPEGGVSELFTGDSCVLCRGANKGKRTCYGLLDVGNPEPKREKSILLGMKTRSRAGSIVPLQLACCDDCRKRFRLVEYIVMASTTIAGALSIIILSMRPINEWLKDKSGILPIAIFVGVTLLAWLISSIIRKKLVKKYLTHTYMDVFELPKLVQMRSMGWFPLTESEHKNFSKLIFSSKRVKQGAYTGEL